jgi:hypothetical protein
MEKQLASKGAELEAAEKEESDLEAILVKENARLDAQILELKLEHKLDYKELDDLNNHKRDERAQQDIERKHRIIDLEFEIQLLRDEMAMMAMEGSVAGFGGDVGLFLCTQVVTGALFLCTQVVTGLFLELELELEDLGIETGVLL